MPNCFVINIGDMVNIWTNRLYTSTLHRVMHTAENTFRVSIPFFYEPNFDAVVKPLAKCVEATGGVVKEKEVVYGLHLVGKVSTNFDVNIN